MKTGPSLSLLLIMSPLASAICFKKQRQIIARAQIRVDDATEECYCEHLCREEAKCLAFIFNDAIHKCALLGPPRVLDCTIPNDNMFVKIFDEEECAALEAAKTKTETERQTEVTPKAKTTSTVAVSRPAGAISFDDKTFVVQSDGEANIELEFWVVPTVTVYARCVVHVVMGDDENRQSTHSFENKDMQGEQSFKIMVRGLTHVIRAYASCGPLNEESVAN